jgi:hypothetical protein
VALTKTVELKILADAGDAQAKLDAADAKAKELDGKSIKMRFRVDESDARGQIQGIRDRAKALGYDDVNIKVRVTGTGRTIADLEAIKHEIDSVDRRSVEGGLFSRLIGGMPLTGGSSLGGGIPILGSLLGPAGLAIVPALGAIGTELVGVVSGFAAAGTGAGAFALLAAPAVKHIETAYQGLNKARAAYTAAQDKEKADPTKANKSAVATAALNLKLAQESIGKLPKSEQDAIKGISGLSREFGKMSRAFEPQAFKAFASGLKLADELLPHVTPFASTFATGLDKLLTQAGKFAQSKGFADWLKQFHSLEGPAIGAIGHGIGETANSVGKLMTVMSGKDVAHTINILFGGISGTINGITAGLHRFMQNYDGITRTAVRDAHQVAQSFDVIRHGVAAATGVVRHFIAGGGHDLANDFDQARHAVAQLGHGVASAFDQARHTVAGVGNFIAGSFDSTRHSVAAVADGIASAFAGVPGKIKGYLSGVGQFIAGSFDQSRHAVASVADSIASAFAGIPGKVKGFFSGAGGWLVSAGSAAIGGLGHGLEAGWGTVSGWVSGLPGKIEGFFSGAGSWLVSAGESVIQGLARGMESVDVGGIAASIGHSIVAHAKSALGIKSPSTEMIPVGEQTVQGLVVGLQNGGVPLLRAGTQTTQTLVQALRSGGSGGSAAAAGRQLAQSTLAAIAKGLEGSPAQIAAAAKKLEAMAPSSIRGWLQMDTAQLQLLARKRKVITAEIQQSEQVAQATLAANTVMTAATAGPDPNATPTSSSQVISGMQYQLSQVKQFTQQIRQLKKEGLNATSLSQIISSGAGPGSQVASALLQGGKAAVSQINSLQKQLKTSASQLGDEAAPAMYQAGVQAGQGLASGLRSESGAIASAMRALVAEMIATAKDALKSHSPARVMIPIGESVPMGVAVGIDRAAHIAIAASGRAAAATVQPWAHGGWGRGGGDLHIHLPGVVSSHGAAKEIHKLLRDYKTKGGNAALGLG